MPHVMFVIDRQDHDRIYYVNSRIYAFHKDFVNGTYLSLERGLAFYEDNYLKSNRRFILGTVAYRMTVDKFTFEFWEGDLITRQILTESLTALTDSFFAPVYFKPNSEEQESVAKDLEAHPAGRVRLNMLVAGELAGELKFEPLNLATGIGQLRILERLTSDTVLDRNQIVIFKQVPIHITPLSGIITTQPASPLSHINMLAKSWGIPNAYIQNADKLFEGLNGKYVQLEVTADGYKLGPANVNAVEERERRWIQRADLVTPPADLDYARLTDLRDQRAADARWFGAKSANLGELMHAKLSLRGHRPNGLAGIEIPAGFAIPFHYYQQFIHSNGLDERISSAVEEDRFVHDPKYRKERLAEIRDWIKAGKIDPEVAHAVIVKAQREFPGQGLFVRSSTNAEDLPNFSGAGLYSTVPNARTPEQLIAAIKTVWASVWNYEAYEARESFGMNHFGVYMGVLVQVGINADSAGVAITTDPFNRAGGSSNEPSTQDPFQALPSGPRPDLVPQSTLAVYINAKRGLGTRVVEGERIAEQVIYRSSNDAIQVLTRSGEDSMLKFDEKGGLKEIKIEPERRVLTDEMVHRLARAASAIKAVFGGKDQDIEWVYAKGQLYIVQSRPYVQSN